MSIVFACILCMLAFWMASVLSWSDVMLWHFGALPNDQLLVLWQNELKNGFLSDWCSPGPGDFELSFVLFNWGRCMSHIWTENLVSWFYSLSLTYILQYHLMLVNSIGTSFESLDFFNSLSVCLPECSALNLLVHHVSRITYNIEPFTDALLLKRRVCLLRRKNIPLNLPVESFFRRLHLWAA